MTEQKRHVPVLRFPEFSGGWDSLPLNKLAKIGTGNSDTQDRVDNGKYPFFVRSDTIERINSFSFDGEAVLTSGDGVGVGKNFHYISGKFDYHQRVYCIRDFTDKLNGQFFFHYFSDRFYARVIRLSAKNSVDSVRMAMIADMSIPLPPLPEQEKIAAFLGVVDTRVEQLRRKQVLLEQYKKGVMQRIFSGQIRFTDDHGNPFPDWQEKRLGDVAERITRKNTSNNQNVLTISAQQGLVSQQEFFNKSVSAEDITGYYQLHKGEFAYNKSYSKGYPMGAIKRLDRYDIGVVSTLYICFKITSGLPSFFEKVFDSGFMNKAIHKIAQEGARNHGLLNISVVEFFKDILVPYPHPDEQRKIADFLSVIDSKIDSVAKEVEAAQNYKKSLLQQMFV